MLDRNSASVEIPFENSSPLSFDALDRQLKEQRPDFKATMVIVRNNPELAYQLRAGRSGMIYQDPYTGQLREPKSAGVHHVLHTLEEIHRWLGMKGEYRVVGKMINGVFNLAFLFLCLSGLYLWFPRKWSWRAWRPILWFVRRYKGKARDYNWHNVLGFWCMPVLTILVATAVVFSFEWAHKLVFTIAGEDAPGGTGPAILAVAPAVVPEPDAGMEKLSYDVIVEEMKGEYPGWEAIAINYPRPGAAKDDPLSLTLLYPALFTSRGWNALQVDPYRGDVLKKVGFKDRTPGVRARIWIRFLHTGEAFGIFGKIIAVLATAGSLVLVYTGFMLSWRRFFKRRVVR